MQSQGAPSAPKKRMTFIVAVADWDDARSNVLTSPIVQSKEHQWLLPEVGVQSFRNIARLYAETLEYAENDIVFFLHPRCYLPESWERDIARALEVIDAKDPNWALVGTLGILKEGPATRYSLAGHAHAERGYIRTEPLPCAVESIDEHCFGMRKAAGLKFDSRLPGGNHHGMDLSLTARARGLSIYAVDACMWLDRADKTRIATERGLQQEGKTRAADYLTTKWGQLLPFASPTHVWSERPPRPTSPAKDPPDFTRIRWEERALSVGDVRFALFAMHKPTGDLGDVAFPVVKSRSHLEEYARFWAGARDFSPRRILELGAYMGGSAVFWTEILDPDKLVVVDLAKEQDRIFDALRQYGGHRGVEGKLKFFWETDQSDAVALHRIVREQFDGPLDLVIDDASHLYEPTRRSFEILFPHLRDGGWYVIEDWTWNFRPTVPATTLGGRHPLSDLVLELVELAARENKLIRTVRLVQGVAFIERGHAVLDDTFRIADYLPRTEGDATTE